MAGLQMRAERGRAGCRHTQMSLTSPETRRESGSKPDLDLFQQPIDQVLELVSVGRFSLGETFSRIHIPARPWPGTAQKIM